MERWYTTTQVGERLGVSRQTVHALIESGRLSCLRLLHGERATIRIRQSDLEAFLARWTDDGDGPVSRDRRLGR